MNLPNPTNKKGKILGISNGISIFLIIIVKNIGLSIFILIFVPIMKKLSYITVMFLSLLIIYSGVGVAIMHYCCVRCESAQNCCMDGCSKCRKVHSCDSKKDCKEEGCTATIYKIDLMKHTSEMTVSVPVIALFYEQINEWMASICMDYSEVYFRFWDPPHGCPRQRLALHSVLII